MTKCPIHNIYEYAPISLWETNYGAIFDYMKEPWAADVKDMEAYFDDHPDRLEECLRRLKIVTMNRETLRMFKAENCEQLICEFAKLFTASAMESFKRILASIHRKKTSINLSMSLLDLEGKVFDIDLMWSVMPGFENDYQRAIVVIVESKDHRVKRSATEDASIDQELQSQVKEAVLQREAMERKRQYLLDIVEQTPDYIASFDANMQMLYNNPAIRKMMGISADEDITKLTLLDYRSKDVVERIKNEIFPIVNHEGFWSGELSSLTRKGERVLCSTIIVAHKDKEGKPINYSCIGRDTRYVKELEKQRGRFEEIIKNMPDFVGMTDKDGNVTYLNAAGRKIMGISEDEDIIKLEIKDFYSESETKRIFTEAIPSARKNKIWTGETKFLTRFGKEIRTLQMIFMGLNDEGEIDHLTTIAKDITQLRKSQQEALEYQRQIAYYSRIENMAEMASGIAHELNQPLTAISNYASGCLKRLEKEEVAPPILEAIQQINQQAQRAGAIIHNIKDFVRKGDVKRSLININNLIRNVLSYTKYDLQSHNIKVKLNLDESLPEIYADKVQIEQVLVNIVQNAIDAFTEYARMHYQYQLQVKTEHDEETIKISIIDNGPGIPKEILQKVFDTFVSKKSEGLGIGLALSKSIIQQHQGQLNVRSEVGVGAEFCIELPVHVEAFA